MIKTILYFVFIALVLSCTSKTRDVRLEVLKDGVSEIEKNNYHWVLRLEKSLSKESFRSKVAAIDSAKALIYMRDAALRNEITLKKYADYLFDKYSSCEIADSNRLARATTLLSIYNNKTDSLEYYQSLLSLLMLERDLVEEVCMNNGYADHKCMGFHIPMYSECDTVKVNASFTFIACGFEKLRGSSVLKIHDKFNVILNDEKVTIPIEHKIIGNAVVVTIIPSKPGKYVITGGMGIFDQNLEYQASDSFRQEFYAVE